MYEGNDKKEDRVEARRRLKKEKRGDRGREMSKKGKGNGKKEWEMWKKLKECIKVGDENKEADGGDEEGV